MGTEPYESLSLCISELMAQPILLCSIFLAYVLISVEAAGTAAPHSLLECRICRNANFLEDCKETQRCARNEECYIDEIITPQLQIIFNAGCRSKAICNSSDPHTRKRAEIGLIACTHCCDTYKSENSTECNANLCGIKTKSGDHTNQCYFCGAEDDAMQGAVTDPRKCRKIKFCADDEVCHVTTKNTAGIITHEFGCQQLLQCQLLTAVSLETIGVNTHVDIQHLSETGELINTGRKRQLAVCDICCGYGLCNDDECKSVRTRIAEFAKKGRFNFTSLQTM